MELTLFEAIAAVCLVTIAGAIVFLVVRLHKTLNKLDVVIANTNSVVSDVRSAKDNLKFGAMSGILKIANLMRGASSRL